MLEQLMTAFDEWMADYFPKACLAATKGSIQGKALCLVIFKGEFRGAEWFPSEAIPMLKDYVFIPVPTLEPKVYPGQWGDDDLARAGKEMVRRFSLILMLECDRRSTVLILQHEQIKTDFQLIKERYKQE